MIAMIRLLFGTISSILKMATEATKQQFLAYTRDITKLYRAILPDVAASEFRTAVTNFLALAKRIRSHTPLSRLQESGALLRSHCQNYSSKISSEKYTAGQGQNK